MIETLFYITIISTIISTIIYCLWQFVIRFRLWMSQRVARRAADRTAAREEYQHIFDSRPHRVDCAWCNRVLRDGREPVSHGICPECAAEFEQAAA